MIVKTACLLIVSVLLLACGSDDIGGLPAERPTGTVSGQAVAAAIGNAQVTVYGFGDGARGARLGSTATDDSGAYAIDIQAPSQAIVVEIRGGSYVEEASGVPVALTEGQVLRAVGRYVSGRPLTLMVTPLTHMAAALAEYRVANGMAVEQAIDEANAEVDQFFALDTRATRPVLITTVGDPLTELNNDALYGFYLAGLSNWTLWADIQNQTGQPPHATYNSISLAQILYHDLRSDGLLDGRGFNQEATELVPLGFGNVALDADVYRLAFSLHMLAAANSDTNKTGLTIDDLLDAAHAIAAQTTLLPDDDTDPVAIDEQAPELTLQQLKPVGDEDTLLSLEQFADQAQSGSFLLRVTVGGLLGAERLTTAIIGPDGEEIDDSPRENILQGSGQILVIVDTTHYTDGEYQFELTAVDALGKATVESFNVKFDNTGPVIAVTSPRSTNQPTITLSGTFDDKIAGVASITVAGQEAALFTDDTWRLDDVALVAGKNIIPISVIDQVGNRRDDFAAEVYLDDIAPVIDSTDTHGQARFSNGDGTASDPAPLQDSNAILYFESDSVDLAGVLIDRTALDASVIPYFAFGVSDLTDTDTPTAAEEIQVQIQYRRNDQVLNPWHALAPVDGEFLIPLASETLATDWHRTKPDDQHVIDIEVTDPAGNKTTAQFDFYADLYVPVFDIANDNGDASNHIDDLGQTIFTTTAFSERASLNGISFASTAYTFSNTVGKAFYVSLNDDSLHTTTQTVDKLLREHRVHVKAIPEWRVGLMVPTDNCPEMTSWTTTSSVWNWTGSAWVEEQVPEPTYGAEENISKDAPLPDDPAPSTWSDMPDFDNFLEIGFSGNSLTQKTYSYDYKLDSRSDVEISAYVSDWTLRDSVSRKILKTCPKKRYFQQRETYAYESVTGYPKGVLSTEVIANTPNFATTSYTLTDNDTGTVIVPVNGWYRIPAGHSVTIEKWVTTPDLTLHNDDISNVDDFPSYDTPNRYDKTLSWSVARNLGITLSHDAGEANIPAMSTRSMTVGEDSATYQTSRQ